MAEGKMVGWHHQLNGHDEQTPGDGDRGVWHAAVRGVAKSQMQLSD